MQLGRFDRRTTKLLSCTCALTLCSTIARAQTTYDAPQVVGDPATSTTQAAEENFQFNGYWRAGFDTASPFTGREFVDGAGGNSFYNFIERLTSEAPDNQGAPNLKTSRHTRDPNYLKLQLSKTFTNDVRITFGIDSKGAPVHESTPAWADSANQGAAIQISNSLRIRDLYTSLPTTSDLRVWAGSRQFEFEDLRLFDSGNPFDTSTLGVGLESSKTIFAMGYAKAKREAVVAARPATVRGGTARQAVLVDTKDATLLYRTEVPLEKNYSIIPTFKVVVHGATQADATTGNKRQAIRGSQEFMAGAIMARFDGETGNTGHSTMGVSLKPPDGSEASLRGDNSGFDIRFFAEDANIISTPEWGLLTAISIEQTSFKNNQKRYVVMSDGSIVASGETSKSQRTIALGIQPVLYVTKSVHLAMDLSYSFRDKKLQKNQSNALLVTPIFRYAFSQSPLGSPQFYTSFTYGKYDLDFKRQIDGSFKNTLSTMQTGIELWF
ncbi:MAG: carbohydrate porin [Silvanigrellaceae bacterium]